MNFLKLPNPARVTRSPRSLQIALVYSRPPLPMNRADQLTVAHLIEFLWARGHVVDLFTLDEGRPPTPEILAWLKTRCRRVELFPHSFLASLWGIVTSAVRLEPLQIGWFSNSAQKRAVRDAFVRNRYDIGYSYYFRSAPTIRHLANKAPDTARILAMQLSQSLNTRRIMENHISAWEKLVYSTEAYLVRNYEARIWKDFDRTILIGERDVDEIRDACRERHLPEIDNYALCAHGVDVDRFAPDRNAASVQRGLLVFSGVMGTNTNADAAIWFVENVWPQVKQQRPFAELMIVGRNPRKAVLALAKSPGVTVTGEVSDVAEYIGRAEICINPVRAAAGMQNKLLEFLALGKPIVATSTAMEGIYAVPEEHLLTADEPDDFAAKIIRLIDNPESAAQMGARGRAFVEKNWTWEAHWLRLEEILIQAVDEKRAASGAA